MTDDQQRSAARRPHLIHIGYAKTGSSFLRQWFQGHPEIGYSAAGFGGISRPAEVGKPAGGMRLRVTSSETFASPTLSEGKPAAGAYHAAQARTCETLAELFPSAHILIVARGYRSMIMSSYSQYVRSGGSISLEELIRDAHRENPWDYDFLVSLYRRQFGADKVLVLPWELLRDDPSDFFSQLESRFGLSHHPPPAARVNSSLSPAEMRWYPRVSRLIQRAPVGNRLRQAIARRFARLSRYNRLAGAIRLLQKVAPASPVSAAIIPPDLLEHFRGKASFLASDPLFAGYAAEYLNDAPALTRTAAPAASAREAAQGGRAA
jgi:hypothetical protein